MAYSTFPRAAAVRVLTRVLSDRKLLDEALAAAMEEVSPEQRAWLQEVCSGTLRWKGRIDLAIDSAALKKKPTGWLRKVLMIGAYQIIAQEKTPSPKVVSETVDAVKKKEGEAPARFANAILRRVAEHAERWRELEVSPDTSATEAAEWASLPPWLWKKLVEDRGFGWARDYARASLERPTLWIRAKNADWKPEWTTPGPVAGSLAVTGQPPFGGLLTQWEGFAEGDFFVQDISSQTLVAEITEEVKRASGASGKLQALDLCAAPGGKSVGMQWSGMTVLSTDRDEPRIKLLRQTVERVAPEVTIITREEARELQGLDLVWVDAPCTGSGILRRHPDVRWLKREDELKGLNELQAELLKEAWNKVKPGGFLAYSVCSVLRQEGSGLVEKLSFPGEKVKEWFLLPQNPPHGDGFWAVLFRKPA